MTYKEAVNCATAKLHLVSESSKLDAQLLVCKACNINRSKLFSYPERTFSTEEKEEYESVLNRRIQGEPIAYITGKKEFWSLDFNVNNQVLIPRPETELLVEITLRLIKDMESPRILDLGTGSGVIAISIAKERRDAFMVATDISTAALEIAQSNLSFHQVNVQIINSNWYGHLTNELFDVVVCNPPYVARDDLHLDKYVTQFEPENAVISNNNGIRDLEIVISGAHKHLRTNGKLVVEHGFQQTQKVQQLFESKRFLNIVTHQDLCNLDRVTAGSL